MEKITRAALTNGIFVIEEGGGGHKHHGHKVYANTEPHVRGEMVLQDEGLSEKGRGEIEEWREKGKA